MFIALIIFITACVYFFLPAYLANMTPPLVRRAGILNALNKPVDGGKMLLGLPILGFHKTWRGVVFGFAVGFLAVLLQGYLCRFSFIQSISFLDYRQNIFLLAFLLPGGAIFGDLLFAFIKRRLRVAPGARFLPWDQTNYVIGAFILLFPFFNIGIIIWMTLFVLTFFLHIAVNRLGYLLGLHGAKW